MTNTKITSEQQITELELQVKFLRDRLNYYEKSLSSDEDSRVIVDHLIEDGYHKELLLNSIREINKRLLDDPNDSSLLDEIMNQVQDILHSTASSVLLCNPNRTHLYFEVARGEAGTEIKKLVLDIQHGIGGYVARSGHSVIENDPYSNRYFNPEFDKATKFRTRNILCTPLKHHGEIIGVLQVINSLDSKNFTPKELRILEIFADQAAITILKQRMMQELIEKSEALEKANLAKTTFLANVSHELRTPLTPVLAWSSMLKDSLDEPEFIIEGLDVIEDQCSHLNKLITNLIHLAQIDSDQVYLDPGYIELEPIALHSWSQFQKQAEEKNIQVEFQPCEDSFTIYADEGKVALCLEQIFDNSIKFNDPTQSKTVTITKPIDTS